MILNVLFPLHYHVVNVQLCLKMACPCRKVCMTHLRIHLLNTEADKQKKMLSQSVPGSTTYRCIYLG